MCGVWRFCEAAPLDRARRAEARPHSFQETKNRGLAGMANAKAAPRISFALGWVNRPFEGREGKALRVFHPFGFAFGTQDYTDWLYQSR